MNSKRLSIALLLVVGLGFFCWRLPAGSLLSSVYSQSNASVEADASAQPKSQPSEREREELSYKLRWALEEGDVVSAAKLIEDGASFVGTRDGSVFDNLKVAPNLASLLRQTFPSSLVHPGLSLKVEREQLVKLLQGDAGALAKLAEAQRTENLAELQAKRMLYLLTSTGGPPPREAVDYIFQACIRKMNDGTTEHKPSMRELRALSLSVANDAAKNSPAMQLFLKAAEREPYLYDILDVATFVGLLILGD